jgi:hypothetical protein
MLFKRKPKREESQDILPPYTPIEYKWNVQTLFLGFFLGLEGVKNTLIHEKTRNKLLRDIFLFLTVSLAIYVIGHLISIPFHLLKVFKLFGFSNAGFLAEKFNKILSWIIRVYPQAILLIIRYIYPKYLDDLFFESFKGYPITYEKDQIPSRELLVALNYAQRLSTCKPSRSYIKLGVNYCKRLSKKLVKGSLVYILISLPFVGKLILPGMLVMAISQIFPFNLSCVMGVLSVIFPYIKKLVTAFLFNCIFGIRTMNREVLEPYFCRVKMTPEEKIRWFKTYEPLLFGFMGLFYILFLQPWYGPLFFAIAQGAIPTLLVEIFKYHQPDLK